jgi:hydroxypyruvate isomerase
MSKTTQPASSSRFIGQNGGKPSRRAVLGSAAVAALAGTHAVLAADDPGVQPAAVPPPAARNGRIKQSLVSWCYLKHFGNSVDKLCLAAKELGVASIELIPVEHWPTIKKHGLDIAIASSHGFVQGMNNPKHWERCHKILNERIDQCAAAGVPSVISFTGMREPGIADDVGANNCVEGFKQVVGHAEKAKVTICLEMLNSRYDRNMVGHPGYQGDHTDYCIDILKRVGSERLKLLFDIYHVQIMDGDVITRLRQHKQYVGHVHTAGVPGRGELDRKQETNYPAVMDALLEVGYQGYVGQEYMPTREVMAGLREAVALCDV